MYLFLVNMKSQLTNQRITLCELHICGVMMCFMLIGVCICVSVCVCMHAFVVQYKHYIIYNMNLIIQYCYFNSIHINMYNALF